MCCMQSERVFPPSDSEDSDDPIPRFLPGVRGESSRSCPPRREHPKAQWSATSHTYLPGIGSASGFSGECVPGSNISGEKAQTSFNTTRRSFSSSLVAELKAVGPGPSLDECSFSVSDSINYPSLYLHSFIFYNFHRFAYIGVHTFCT